MGEPIIITAQDPILKTLRFKPYQNTEERRVEQFLPGPDEPQTIEVKTPWGAELTAKSGDYVVSNIGKPGDRWPIDREIFENSYLITRPGYCIKNAVTELVPMIDLTNGNPDQLVTVQTMEGPETVRAADFYLARGIKGEIWPYPAHRMTGTLMMPKPDLKNIKKK